MTPSIRRILGAASLLLQVLPSAAQTYTNCNPITQGGCPADSALGRTVNIDFTSGASDSFTPQGEPTYDSNGVSFTIAQSGNSPQLTSKWYIMFGKVSVTLKAAPGTGIVSSVVLQSDCLDEIDWEWLGKDDTQVQTNYFGKGITGSYNRGAFHANSGNQDGFITYTIDWTSEQIVWQINGQTVRALSASDAEAGQYPQTPMQLKMGAWSGGDPSNSQGTIDWAGGSTDYSAGPYTMQVKSITVQDYSTGTQYEYSGTSGNWQDVKAVGGSVYSGSGSGTDSAAPAVTSVSTGQPMPFEGTHRSDSTYSTPSVYPWVPLASTLSTETATYTNYPGLPSGWTVTSSGKVVPPSSAPSPYPDVSSTSFAQPFAEVSSSQVGSDQAFPTMTITARTLTWESLPISTPAYQSTSYAEIWKPPISPGYSYTYSYLTSPPADASSVPSALTYDTSVPSTTSSAVVVETTFSTVPQGSSTSSTPAVPVQTTNSAYSARRSSIYPAALLAMGMLASIFVL